MLRELARHDMELTDCGMAASRARGGDGRAGGIEQGWQSDPGHENKFRSKLIQARTEIQTYMSST